MASAVAGIEEPEVASPFRLFFDGNAGVRCRGVFRDFGVALDAMAGDGVSAALQQLPFPFV